MKSLEEIKAYAIKCHADTNHLYDGKPYSFHLQMVADKVIPLLIGVSPNHHHDIIAACWCHDLIEDTRQTYNDVMKETSRGIAEIVYSVTNEKGRSRSDRANDKYYEGICNNPNALIVKVADRLANLEYSKENNDKMYSIYLDEHYSFCDKLKIRNSFNILYIHLSRLIVYQSLNINLGHAITITITGSYNPNNTTCITTTASSPLITLSNSTGTP